MPGNLLQGIPLEVMATWPRPNYDHPDQQRKWLIPFSLALQALTAVMVALRLWVRIRKEAGPFGLDDLLLIPGFLAGIVFTVTIYLAVDRYGIDRHIWDVRPVLFEHMALMAWISQFVFLVSTSATKVSVLLFYRRLSKGFVTIIWLWATYVAIAITAAYCLAFCLTLIFNCNPTNAYWRSYRVGYTEQYSCAETRGLNLVSGILSVVSDLYAVVLPMCMLRHFEAPRRQKMALNAIFALGLVVVGAGIARTYYLTDLGSRIDTTWHGYNLYLWSQLEIQLSLICACAPALRVVFRRYFHAPIARRLGGGRRGAAALNNPNDGPADTEAMVSAISYHENGVDHPPSHSRHSSTNTVYDDKLVARPMLSVVDEDGESLTPSQTYHNSHHAYQNHAPTDYETFVMAEMEKERQSTYYQPQHHPILPQPVYSSNEYAPPMSNHSLGRTASMRSVLSGPLPDPFAPYAYTSQPP